MTTERPPAGGPQPAPGAPNARPVLNRTLFDDIQFLPGVGPRRAEALKRLGVRTIGDFLEYVPVRHDKTETRLIENLDEGMIATVVGQITSARMRFGGRGRAFSATLTDNTGRCGLIWFNAPWMADRIRTGMVVRATGRVGSFGNLPQLQNPKIAPLGEDAAPADESDPATFAGIYPATAMLTSEQIARLMAINLDRMLAMVEEWFPADFLKERNMPPRRWALEVTHRPTSEPEVDRARLRLAYDELLLLQVATQWARQRRMSIRTAAMLPCTDEMDRRIRARFPFALTAAQDRAVREITADLALQRPMNRMLQGDVGCGKTVVALYAALVSIANKRQVAFMAPTELLANQHAVSIERFLKGSRVRHALLTGGMKLSERRRTLERIERGELDLVVGTHALIQGDVRFKRLGLVIIDEQHRFGVRQRAVIRDKGPAPHYLVMTATPIPRTLAMTVFGDLDVTTIDDLPPGRSPVHTRIVLPSMRPAAWEFVRREIALGGQAFVVYPLIDESDKVEARAATVEFEHLRDSEFRGTRVGLLHGRMSAADRDAVMADFVAGKLGALVATTVVEVGIDIPNATCMVVEHAERYGLSQLHQLRGRIGRGEKPGHCLLMTASRRGSENERLNVLAQTTDGFRIAEEDLRIRGPGEMLGVRQHGLPDLRVADLIRDAELLMSAQRDAGDILRNDPQLGEPVHRILKQALAAKYRDRLNLFDAG